MALAFACLLSQLALSLLFYSKAQLLRRKTLSSSKLSVFSKCDLPPLLPVVCFELNYDFCATSLCGHAAWGVISVSAEIVWVAFFFKVI